MLIALEWIGSVFKKRRQDEISFHAIIVTLLMYDEISRHAINFTMLVSNEISRYTMIQGQGRSSPRPVKDQTSQGQACQGTNVLKMTN